MMIRILGAATAAGILFMGQAGAYASEKKDILNTYADIAFAKYEDSTLTAKSMDAAIDALIKNPNSHTLENARAAWKMARVPYQQTEVFRFGNPIVDEWEGRVNAWPLDEGLIDYVDANYYGAESDENTLYTVNVIANEKLMVNGKEVDATNITPDLLSNILHEAEGVESNVATGYHAIEFMLWGQDLQGTDAGAGNRMASDFDANNCTNNNCDRRAAYLKSASTLLISDLDEMLENWTENGAARSNLLSNPDAGVGAILTGMGSLSYGELAGERMKLGLLVHDPEEEHDCFSDNTHNSHYFDQIGVRNVYLGHYKRIDGSIVSGASVSDLVASQDQTLDQEINTKLNHTVTAMAVMRARAESIEAYDQMLGEGNVAGNATVQAAIDGLIDQTRSIERAVALLKLEGVTIEGSDSLDNQSAVFE